MTSLMAHGVGRCLKESFSSALDTKLIQVHRILELEETQKT